MASRRNRNRSLVSAHSRWAGRVRRPPPTGSVAGHRASAPADGVGGRRLFHQSELLLRRSQSSSLAALAKSVLQFVRGLPDPIRRSPGALALIYGARQGRRGPSSRNVDFLKSPPGYRMSNSRCPQALTGWPWSSRCVSERLTNGEFASDCLSRRPERSAQG
jgi:hypothetical protein